MLSRLVCKYILVSILYGSTNKGILPAKHDNVFSININGNDFTVLYNFKDHPNSFRPYGICLYNKNIYGISESTVFDKNNLDFIFLYIIYIKKCLLF